MKQENPRRERVENFLRDEVALVAHGMLPTVSSTQTLADRFGYSTSQAWRIKKDMEFHSAAHAAREYFIGEIQPSRNLARMIGFLAGKGFVDTSNGFVAITGLEDKASVDIFEADMKELFGITTDRRESWEGGQRKIVSSFVDLEVTSFLGDLRRDQWPRTIMQQHAWIFTDHEYEWGLIEGLFESKGNAQKKGKHRGELVFSDSTGSGSIFIKQLLLELGVHTPVRQFYNAQTRQPLNVAVFNRQDIQVIASNISSRNLHKETQLEVMRGLTAKGFIPLGEILAEWYRLFILLEHRPTYHDVTRLRSLGETPYATTAYQRMVGEGNFATASEVLSDTVGPLDHALRLLKRMDSEKKQRTLGKLSLALQTVIRSNITNALTELYSSKSIIELIQKREELESAVSKAANDYEETKKNPLIVNLEYAIQQMGTILLNVEDVLARRRDLLQAHGISFDKTGDNLDIGRVERFLKSYTPLIRTTLRRGKLSTDERKAALSALSNLIEVRLGK